VHALKLGAALPAADVMAPMMLRGLPARTEALVPVPGGPGRVRRRGFDHGAVLARALARRAGGVPVVVALERGAGRAQAASSRRERLAGPVVGPTGAAVPARVVLVDDVHTTGATFSACARALREAGAADVTALSFSRTLTDT
jgi:predicted amidophosphoribosyltransferase